MRSNLTAETAKCAVVSLVMYRSYRSISELCMAAETVYDKHGIHLYRDLTEL